jgi:membrane associated rhomboid family serine protease
LIPFPVGDENPTSRPAFVNLGLIAVNGALFLWFNVVRGQGFFQMSGEDLQRWALLPGEPTAIRFLASMFLHGNLQHLLGNMWFLHIFGDNVEDKIGHGRYLLLYLAWGAIASAAFLAFGRPLGAIAGVPAEQIAAQWDRLPMVGASGAISGVMGAYLIFFPRARIRMVWWMILVIVPLSLPAIVVIGMYFFQDLVLAALNLGRPVMGGVAYAAHTGGMVAGILVALVAKPFLRGSSSTAWDRDTGFAGRDGGGAGDGGGAAAREWVRPPAGARAGLRDSIAGAVLDDRMDLALDLHREWVDAGRPDPLPPRIALEIGHELLRRGRVEEAADVYERFLAEHPASADGPDAAFRLGMIHARATGDLARARELLGLAAAKHPDPAARERARRELGSI